MEPAFGHSCAQPMVVDQFNLQPKQPSQVPPHWDGSQYQPVGYNNAGYDYYTAETPMTPAVSCQQQQQFVPAGPSSSTCEDPNSPSDDLFLQSPFGGERPVFPDVFRTPFCRGVDDVAPDAPSLKPAAVSVLPNLNDWPGLYDFHVAQGNRRGGGWMYSDKTKKLYIEMGKELKLSVQFTVSQENLVLRVMPAFTTADLCHKSVTRCAIHQNPDLEANRTFGFPEHVIRLGGRHEAHGSYVKDVSGHLSVLTTAQCPYNGDHLQDLSVKFMCLGTCSIDGSGEKKRATREIGTIFTLERPSGEVVGRSVMRVRVCACPSRDMTADEKREAGETKPTKKKVAKKRKMPIDTNVDQPAAHSPSTQQRLCQPVLVPRGRTETFMLMLADIVAAKAANPGV